VSQQPAFSVSKDKKYRIPHLVSCQIKNWVGEHLTSLLLLRSEIPSGMCAKLRTVAASNNRDHPTRSLYYCLFAPHTYIFVLRAHPVRGGSYNQRNTTGEVATLSTRSIGKWQDNPQFEWLLCCIWFSFDVVTQDCKSKFLDPLWCTFRKADKCW